MVLPGRSISIFPTRLENINPRGVLFRKGICAPSSPGMLSVLNFSFRVATAFVVLLNMVAPAYASSQSDELRVLGDKLAAIRASSGTGPALLAPLPDVRALHGATRQQLLSSLGMPSNCIRQPEAGCGKLQAWSYEFFLLPAHERGGGPSLVLSFGAEDAIASAEWRWSR